MIKNYVILYVATLVVMGVFDAIWLGAVAREFYKSRLGELLDFRMLPAILFYLLYVGGVVVFASARETSWADVLMYGAFFGFLAYATYDLTNMATLKPWSWTLSLVDMAWGTFNTAASATVGWLIAKQFAAS